MATLEELTVEEVGRFEQFASLADDVGYVSRRGIQAEDDLIFASARRIPGSDDYQFRMWQLVTRPDGLALDEMQLSIKYNGNRISVTVSEQGGHAKVMMQHQLESVNFPRDKLPDSLLVAYTSPSAALPQQFTAIISGTVVFNFVRDSLRFAKLIEALGSDGYNDVFQQDVSSRLKKSREAAGVERANGAAPSDISAPPQFVAAPDLPQVAAQDDSAQGSEKQAPTGALLPAPGFETRFSYPDTQIADPTRLASILGIMPGSLVRLRKSAPGVFSDDGSTSIGRLAVYVQSRLEKAPGSANARFAFDKAMRLLAELDAMEASREAKQNVPPVPPAAVQGSEPYVRLADVKDVLGLSKPKGRTLAAVSGLFTGFTNKKMAPFDELVLFLQDQYGLTSEQRGLLQSRAFVPGGVVEKKNGGARSSFVPDYSLISPYVDVMLTEVRVRQALSRTLNRQGSQAITEITQKAGVFSKARWSLAAAPLETLVRELENQKILTAQGYENLLKAAAQLKDELAVLNEIAKTCKLTYTGLAVPAKQLRNVIPGLQAEQHRNFPHDYPDLFSDGRISLQGVVELLLRRMEESAEPLERRKVLLAEGLAALAVYDKALSASSNEHEVIHVRPSSPHSVVVRSLHDFLEQRLTETEALKLTNYADIIKWLANRNVLPDESGRFSGHALALYALEHKKMHVFAMFGYESGTLGQVQADIAQWEASHPNQLVRLQLPSQEAARGASPFENLGAAAARGYSLAEAAIMLGLGPVTHEVKERFEAWEGRGQLEKSPDGQYSGAQLLLLSIKHGNVDIFTKLGYSGQLRDVFKAAGNDFERWRSSRAA